MPEGFSKFTPAQEARQLTPQEITAAATSLEHGPEIAEQIDQEEERLTDNIARSESVLDSASKKERTSPWNLSRIQEAYDRAKQRIDGLALSGFTAAATLLPASFAVDNYAEKLKGSQNIVENIDASHWSTIGTQVLETGLVGAAAVGGAWAIGRGINWLARKIRENSLEGAQA